MRAPPTKVAYELFDVIRKKYTSRLLLFMEHGLKLEEVRDDFDNSLLHVVVSLGDTHLDMLKVSETRARSARI